MDNNIQRYLMPICFFNKLELEQRLIALNKQLLEKSLMDISIQYIRSIHYSENIIVLLAVSKEEIKAEINELQKYIQEFTGQENFQFYVPDKIYYHSKPVGKGGKIVFMNPPGGMVNKGLYKKYNPSNRLEEKNEFNLIEEEAQDNELMKKYMEEINITASSIRLLNQIGIEPNILVGASMGEIALLLSSNFLNTYNRNDDTKGIIQRICRSIKAVLDNQDKLAEQYYGSKPEKWEKWYLKCDIAKLKKLIEPFHDIFIIIIGSDKDAVITGEAISINHIVHVLGCYAKQLDDPGYIHTEVLEQMYFNIYQDCLKENVFLDTENTSYEIYSAYLGMPLNNTMEAFANSIATVLTKPIDFSSLLMNIYNDGGRIFIDLSTNGICAAWAKACFKNADNVRVLKTYSQIDKSQHLGQLLAVLCSEHVELDYTKFYHLNNNEVNGSVQNFGVSELILKQIESNMKLYKLNLRYKQKWNRLRLHVFEEQAKKQSYLYNRKELEEMTDGNLSDVLGGEYKQIDSYAIRARMPSPPYLFVSRVLSMNARFKEFSPSFIITEYDFTEDCILRTGDVEISPVVASEASHAGIFLASVIGVDSIHKGNARFRIVNASTITKSKENFKVGDTMRMEFHIKEIFYFKEMMYLRCCYNVYLHNNLVSETKCLAGFFSELQLKSSKLKQRKVYNWKTNEVIFNPATIIKKKYYSKSQVKSFLLGNNQGCFEDSELHPGRVIYKMDRNAFMIDEITEISYKGGKFGYGYIKSKKQITEDFWPFKAHFKNDPVLPGTVMIEGMNQTIQLYAVHLGIYRVFKNAKCAPTLDHAVKFSFLGQILPQEGDLEYYIYLKKFVKEKDKFIMIMDAEAIIDNFVVLKQDDISMEYGS